MIDHAEATDPAATDPAASRPTHCHDCGAVLEYARSGWATTMHAAYTCEGCPDRDPEAVPSIICWTCLVTHEECSACRGHGQTESAR